MRPSCGNLKLLDQGGGNHDVQRLLKQKLVRFLRNPTTHSQEILKARTPAARGRVALNNCQAHSSKTKDGHAGATLGRNGSELKPFAKECSGFGFVGMGFNYSPSRFGTADVARDYHALSLLLKCHFNTSNN